MKGEPHRDLREHLNHLTNQYQQDQEHSKETSVLLVQSLHWQMHWQKLQPDSAWQSLHLHLHLHVHLSGVPANKRIPTHAIMEYSQPKWLARRRNIIKVNFYNVLHNGNGQMTWDPLAQTHVPRCSLQLEIQLTDKRLSRNYTEWDWIWVNIPCRYHLVFWVPSHQGHEQV